MIEGEGIKPGWNPAVMHAVAGELATSGQKAGNDSDLLGEAGRLYEEVFRRLPFGQFDARNDAAIRSISAFKLAGHYEEILRFGPAALEGLGESAMPGTRRKLEEMIDEAAIGLSEIYSTSS